MLEISRVPNRCHIIEAGGLASAMHRRTTESLPSSMSWCGMPTNLTSGGSVNIIKKKQNRFN